MRRHLKRGLGWMAAGLGLAAAGYAAYVTMAWARYGRAAAPAADETDPLLDRFIPEYEVAERHHVRVAAPPAVVLAAASETDLEESAVVRAIIRTREIVLGAHPDAVVRPKGLLAQTASLGWGRLAEIPGREIVMGAVTQPWKPAVVFRALPPDQFAAFREPDYVKIVWTIRADPAGEGRSVFRTETRVATTDREARRKFRWYWARFSPGIILIRWMLLKNLKAEAERRAN